MCDGWGVTANRCKVSFGGDENVLKLDCGDSAQLCEYCKLCTLKG